MKPSLLRRAVAEFAGSLLLLAAVVGSGIMGERLAAGNVAIALLANTLATGAALVALILAFGPVSGAHFNPAVTLVDAWQHAMFGESVYAASTKVRSGGAQAFSEFVATFGLIAVIWGVARTRASATPFA